MLKLERYRILTIGKTRKQWIKDGIAVYLKRMPGLKVVELREGDPKRESETIKAALRNDEQLVALAEEGETLTSVEFSNHLQSLGSQKIVFTIGGSKGLTEEIKSLASWKLSLSPLTFPHELAALILAEQIYRAQNILRGTPYHRD